LTVPGMSGQFKVLDLSGYMFSGKAAVSDLLREFKGIHVPNYRVEFDLLRISGGLIDLRHALDDWSPIRTHSALNRFEKTIKKLAATPGFPQKFYSTGFGYARLYPDIIECLEQFLTESVTLEWETPWPYDDLEDSGLATFVRKLLGRVGHNKMRHYRLTFPDAFYPAAQGFVHRILTRDLNVAEYGILVTHNALEPFDPGKNLVLLGEKAQCIVVDRDPRDIYATAITTQQGFNDNLEFYRRIAGAHDVDTFIKRYNLYRSMINDLSDRVLRVNFEDLVTNYQATVDNVCSFLELGRTDHQEPYKYFDPERSRHNMELWKLKELEIFKGDFQRIFEHCIPKKA